MPEETKRVAFTEPPRFVSVQTEPTDPERVRVVRPKATHVVTGHQAAGFARGDWVGPDDLPDADDREHPFESGIDRLVRLGVARPLTHEERGTKPQGPTTDVKPATEPFLPDPTADAKAKADAEKAEADKKSKEEADKGKK